MERPVATWHLQMSLLLPPSVVQGEKTIWMSRNPMTRIAFSQAKLYVLFCLSDHACVVLSLEAEGKEMTHQKGLFLAILELSDAWINTSIPQENTVKAGNAVHGDLAKTSIWVRGASSRLFLGLNGSHALSFLFSWGPNVALKVAEKWIAFKISQFKAWAFAELS